MLTHGKHTIYPPITTIKRNLVYYHIWKANSMTSLIHHGRQYFTTSKFHNFCYNGAVFKILSPMAIVYKTYL